MRLVSRFGFDLTFRTTGHDPWFDEVLIPWFCFFYRFEHIFMTYEEGLFCSFLLFRTTGHDPWLDSIAKCQAYGLILLRFEVDSK